MQSGCAISSRADLSTRDTLLNRSIGGLYSRTRYYLLYIIYLAHQSARNVFINPPIGYRWPDPDVYYRGKRRVPHHRRAGVSRVRPPVDRDECFLYFETLNRCSCRRRIIHRPRKFIGLLRMISYNTKTTHNYWRLKHAMLKSSEIFFIVVFTFSHRSRVSVFKNRLSVPIRASRFDRPPFMFYSISVLGRYYKHLL